MGTALDKIRKGLDKARGKLAAQQLGGRVEDVTVQTYTEGNALIGTAGTWSAPFTLTPRPSTDTFALYAKRDEGFDQLGTVKVRGISRVNYTRPQLEGASGTPSRWTIDGRDYTLVELIEDPLEWIAVLKGVD